MSTEKAMSAKKAERTEKESLVRKCSFNPAEHFIQIASARGDGSVQDYLEVKYRVLWFQIYCEENGIKGFIDDSEVSIMPGLNLVRAVCSIYMNGELVAKAAGGQMADESNGNTVIQTATTIAKGRALANAGFGTAMCAFEDNEETPCETGVDTNKTVPTEPYSNNPLIVSNRSNQPESSKISTQKDSVSDKETKTAMSTPTTVKEALKMVFSFGNYKGRTMGEVNALDPQYIVFVANKLKRHPEFTTGAQLILASQNN